MSPRAVLDLLSRNQLLELVDRLGMSPANRVKREALLDAFDAEGAPRLADALPHLKRDALRGLCEAMGLDASGKEKSALVARIVAHATPTEATAAEPARRAPLVSRLALRNYRSIASCDVELGPLVFLVGPNGSGKSNVLDALRLISEALSTTLDHALHERGGIAEVRRRSGGHPTHFGIRVDVTLPDSSRGHYAFEVAAREGGGFSVSHEQCSVGDHGFEVRDGKLVGFTTNVAPAPSPDRLYLVAASGLPEFRPLFDALSRMGFYSIAPERIRPPQRPDMGEVLARDGGNLASVLRRMRTDAPEALQRVEEFLSVVVPGIESVRDRAFGPLMTVEFRQRVEGQAQPWQFSAMNMSDGTLRALAVLVALFQSAMHTNVQLVGIEEPETALHPAAAGAMVDALVSASQAMQVLVTSHSPDLLDDDRVAERVVGVEATDGTTHLGPLSAGSREALQKRLYTAGELLRADRLRPARPREPAASARRLFEARSWR